VTFLLWAAAVAVVVAPVVAAVVADISAFLKFIYLRKA
jgi:hypothetical protein